MLGEQYQVDYIINLQDNATAGIRTFSTAASRLAKAATDFDKISVAFNKMTATFNKQLELKINTGRAHTKLNRIIKQLERIDGLAKGINLGVAGGVSTRGASGSRTVAAPVPRQTRTQPARPIVAPKNGQPLIPRNLEYQVLGPTRLGNVAMLDMFKGMGLMYGISAVGSGIRDIVSQSTEYENIMQTAKNILKTNYKGRNFNASFVDMERIAREVGVETKFTAPEVADAVKFLAMAGLDINAISKSIRPIADIALIGDTDLGSTADVMTNIMTAYGIKPDDMRKTADVMTRTFTMSNTTLMELAESFKMAGSMLHLANVPFETAAAAFGVLGDAGIKATMAGTTMRTIMNNLRNPTKNQKSYWDMLGVRRYDEYGNLREINQIFGDLNKLNGNDERSKTARAKYEELQKQFAPRFEGLQEGSVEYNKVLAEYDKESEAIRKQFGGVDVFRLFRLTAASGAGVLMNSVEKWNKIIEENFLSEGLSDKLAEQKKNTIAGLWAQLRSAFQEGGLKVFEENDGRLRGYLQNGINWLKSSEFTDLLRSIFNLVADFGSMLLKFTKRIVELYNKFRPTINLFLKFQLVLKGIQTVLGSMKMFGNALLYAGSPLFSAVAGNPMVQKRMPGFSGFSAAYAAAAGSQGPNTPPYQATMPNPFLLQQANSEYSRRLSAYNRRVARAGQMQRHAGWASIGGAMAGAYLGSAIAPESEWGATIGGAVGSLGTMALAAAVPGAGWIGALAIGVATGAAALIKYAEACREARKAADQYAESLGKLNIEAWSVGTQHDYFVAAMRVRSSSLLSEQERLTTGIELWRKYYRAMNGEEEEEFDQTKKGYMYASDNEIKRLIDGITGKGGGSYANQLRQNLIEGGKYATAEEAIRNMFGDKLKETPNLKWYELLGLGYGAAYNDNLYNSLSDKNGLVFATAALNENAKIFQDIAAWEEEARRNIGSEQDIAKMSEDFQKKFMTPSGDWYNFTEQAQTNLEDWSKTASYEDWLRMPTYYALMKPQLQNILDKFVSESSAVFDTSGDQLTALLSVYSRSVFGDSSFASSNFKEAYDKWLASNAKTATEKRDMPKQAFKNAIGVFETLSEEQKAIWLPMLERSYWENILGADLSGVSGGYYKPTEETPKPYGDMFEWNATKGIWEYNGMPSLPGWNNGSWIYKPLPAQTGGDTPASSATGQTAYNFPFYNPRTEGNEFPALPSARAVNEALSMAESGIKVQPNVTKNNTYTFTFQIENLRTDMDEDQLSQYIDEKFIPAVIDKLDYSYEGAASA